MMMFSKAITRSTGTMICRSTISQLPKQHHQQSVAALSTQTSQAMAKLQAALEDYRLQHYTQEIPTRFKKEIVSAAAASNKNNEIVNVVGLQHVLQNIGAAHVLSVHEMHSIFMEMGNERGEIPASKMVQLL